MSGKVVFVVGVLGIGGYVGHKAMNYDSTVYNYPKAQVVSMLEDARTELSRADGSTGIRIWSAGRNSDGVKLNMRHSTSAPLIDCRAIITEVAPDQTRVVPDCGGSADSESALANTQAELRVPMFAEHIDATLRQRPFDRSKVDAKQMAAVVKNMQGMQREALKRHDEMEGMMAQYEATERSDSQSLDESGR